MAYTYEALTNDKIKFLQGTQADLNKYLPSSSDSKRGTALEGAFYLTTDTHRLYVGRKVTTGTDANKVFPEEVASGIATVNSESDLANVTRTAQNGDFYYIKDSNIFCVYEAPAVGETTTAGQWVQINPVTAITTFTQNISKNAAATGDTVAFTNSNAITSANTGQYIKLTTSVGTDGNNTALSKNIYFKPGANITLKPSDNNNAIEISSANSQSSLTTTATAITDNKAPATLTDGVNTDTHIYFSGANNVGVSSAITSNENIITITGPDIKGTNITKLGAAANPTGDTHGFRLALDVNNPVTNSAATIAYNSTNNSLLDPVVSYGQSGSKSTAYFYGGTVDLDVYTKTQADSAIDAKILANNRTLDALVYKGTVANGTALDTAISSGNLENGHVYKASADFTYNSISIYKGDLLIAKGTETNGKIPTTATADIWEVVPSGDEPFLTSIYGESNSTSSSPSFGLYDLHLSSGTKGYMPFKVVLDNTNSATKLIGATASKANNTSNGTGTNAEKLLNVQLEHLAPSGFTSTIATDATLTSTTNFSTTSDSIGSGKYLKFLALNPTNGIVRDSFGHVTSISTQEVTLKHNYLKTLTATHSSITGGGKIAIGATDDIGSTITAANIQLTSSSLSITNSGTTSLVVDLVWGDF